MLQEVLPRLAAVPLCAPWGEGQAQEPPPALVHRHCLPQHEAGKPTLTTLLILTPGFLVTNQAREDAIQELLFPSLSPIVILVPVARCRQVMMAEGVHVLSRRASAREGTPARTRTTCSSTGCTRRAIAHSCARTAAPATAASASLHTPPRDCAPPPRSPTCRPRRSPLPPPPPPSRPRAPRLPATPIRSAAAAHVSPSLHFTGPYSEACSTLTDAFRNFAGKEPRQIWYSTNVHWLGHHPCAHPCLLQTG